MPVDPVTCALGHSPTWCVPLGGGELSKLELLFVLQCLVLRYSQENIIIIKNN